MESVQEEEKGWGVMGDFNIGGSWNCADICPQPIANL